MSKFICLWVVTLALLFSPSSQANNEVEIGGLLLDNSKSRLGRDIPNTQGINAQIIEQIVPRAGTKLSLLLNGRVIYVTHLGRRQSPVKDKVEQAIFILIDAMAQSKYSHHNIDLAESGW